MINLNLSTVIVSWNSKKDLESCLASTFKQKTLPLKVIVVDNAPSDGMAKTVVTKFPWVKLIGNRKNVGFAKLFLDFPS